VRTETILKIYNSSFTYIFVWVRKLDSNSLSKTKNWSGRNEVIETSLWPQDKRLYMPRTTDYRNTREDRWIHTELVSTLAKNATKPNPFEIILLQTTRKENNWKTEETLERTVVTLETERIKGSNPWCLWWWSKRNPDSCFNAHSKVSHHSPFFTHDRATESYPIRTPICSPD